MRVEGELEVRAHPGLHDAVLEEVRRRRPAPARVLDLGAGSGALAARFAEAGYAVVACDLEPPAVPPPGVEFAQIDLDELHAADLGEPFDVVLAIEVIEHLGAPGRLLAQLGSVVADDGVVVVSTPNIGSPLSRWYFLRTGRFHQFHEPDLAYGHVMPLSAWQVRLFLERGGLHVTETRGVGDVLAPSGGMRSRLLSRMIALAARLMPGSTRAWVIVFVALKR